jgi:carbon storage regulator CsrA
MLVLSRRPHQEISFTNIGINLRILDVKGNTVKIGIDAPREVTILRQELEIRSAEIGPGRNGHTKSPPNELSQLRLALDLLQQQLDAGLGAAAWTTLEDARAKLRKLENKWDEERSASATVPAGPGTFRSLLVEDDQDQRDLLACFLQVQGCQCESVGDGRAALHYLDSHEQPDFVLLDLMTPHGDGAATVQNIRHNPRLQDLKVFAMCGASPRELGISTGRQGVDGWFPKPLKPRKLWEGIRSSLLAEAR